MANQFSITPANFTLGVQAIGEGAIKGAQAQKNRDALTEFSENIGKWTPQETIKFAAENPEVSDKIIALSDQNSKLDKQERLTQAVKAYTALQGWDAGQQGQPIQQPPQPMTGFEAPQSIEVNQPEQGSPLKGAVDAIAETASMELEAGNPNIQGHQKAMHALMSNKDPEQINKVKNGLLATINSLDPAQAKFLAGLDPADKEGGGTDLGNYVQDSTLIDKAKKPGATTEDKEAGRLAEIRSKAFITGKRQQAEEAGQVAGAKKTAELDVIKEMQPGIERDKAVAVYQGQQEETRDQDAINKGITAAESMPNLKRGLDLLKGIETGGFDNVKLSAKRFFGVEGADEGELSNRLAKAVLAQLRDTFGAQFTEGEGQRLIRIEAGFDKSPANNQRLLRQALAMAQGKVDIAMKIAKRKGNQSAIDQIQGWTDFDLNPGVQNIQSIKTKAEFDSLPSGAKYISTDGKQYRKP